MIFNVSCFTLAERLLVAAAIAVSFSAPAQQMAMCANSTVEIVCEETQSAFCLVMDGHTRGLCRTPRARETINEFRGRVIAEEVGLSADLSSDQLNRAVDIGVVSLDNETIYIDPSALVSAVNSGEIVDGSEPGSISDNDSQSSSFVCGVEIIGYDIPIVIYVSQENAQLAELAAVQKACQGRQDCAGMIHDVNCE